MVQNSGKTPGTDTYKPLNTPELLGVGEGPSGLPVAVMARRKQAITAIEDRWRLDDEWWRSESVARLYYAVLLASGQRLVLYKDMSSGLWYRQSY